MNKSPEAIAWLYTAKTQPSWRDYAENMAAFCMVRAWMMKPEERA